MKPSTTLLLARISIALVFLWNLQCALAFLIWPDRYTSGFGLTGPTSAAVLRGIGILFLMWNVPYLVALWHPLRHKISLYEAIAMQAIGLVGETLIWLSLPAATRLLASGLSRFIVFDFAGLLLLLLALLLVRHPSPPL